MFIDCIISRPVSNAHYTNFWEIHSPFVGNRGKDTNRSTYKQQSASHLKKTSSSKQDSDNSLRLSISDLRIGEAHERGLSRNFEECQVGTAYLDYNQFEGTAASGLGAADNTAVARSLYCKLFQPKTTTGHTSYDSDELAENSPIHPFFPIQHDHRM